MIFLGMADGQIVNSPSTYVHLVRILLWAQPRRKFPTSILDASSSLIHILFFRKCFLKNLAVWLTRRPESQLQVPLSPSSRPAYGLSSQRRADWMLSDTYRRIIGTFTGVQLTCKPRRLVAVPPNAWEGGGVAGGVGRGRVAKAPGLRRGLAIWFLGGLR